MYLLYVQVAAHPFFLSRADVPEHTINTEIEIFK
jgi:hypothetical protein